MIKRTLFTMVATLLASSTWVFAQNEVRPPVDGFGTAPVEGTMPWIAILCTIVFTGAIAAVAFKSSRRTHLD